ncbi:MAG: serine/threonine protein kinase [Deltaproteobacteria bacterium]|nr:serine/threonine protein kinase [Deltaproteobacteria bacterium]
MVYDRQVGAEAKEGEVLNGTYRIGRRLASGGMGTIFEATHLRLDRRYALKVLHPAQAEADKQAYARFQREARLTADLGHPHIVQVIDFNTSEAGDPYYVMELLEGEDLSQRLRREGALPIEDVAQIVQQTASALHAAHQAGVVHRDIKPSNIFLAIDATAQTSVKVLDFGISKVQGSKSVVTKARTLIGTLRWMAPEQAIGSADIVSPATDVFSLAAVTYRMLSGKAPFDGADLPSLVREICTTVPLPLARRVANLPDAVDDVLYKALAKNPAHRYSDIASFASDCQRALLGSDRPLAQHRDQRLGPRAEISSAQDDASKATLQVAVVPLPFDTAVDPPPGATDQPSESIDETTTQRAAEDNAASAAGAQSPQTQPTLGLRRRNMRLAITIAIAAVALSTLLLALFAPGEDSPAAADGGRSRRAKATAQLSDSTIDLPGAARTPVRLDASAAVHDSVPIADSRTSTDWRGAVNQRDRDPQGNRDARTSSAHRRMPKHRRRRRRAVPQITSKAAPDARVTRQKKPDKLLFDTLYGDQ